MQEPKSSSSSPSSSSYSFSITRIAVTQICESIGYQASQPSALNTLTDIATRYLQAIARSASSSAAASRRTHSNAFDIALALEDLASVLGFPGCSATSVDCVLHSWVFSELERFLVFSEEIPFAKPLGRRGGGGGGGESVGDDGLMMKAKHVPRWLPAMPVMGIEEGGEGEGRWEEEEDARFRERRIRVREEGGEVNGTGNEEGGMPVMGNEEGGMGRWDARIRESRIEVREKGGGVNGTGTGTRGSAARGGRNDEGEMGRWEEEDSLIRGRRIEVREKGGEVNGTGTRGSVARGGGLGKRVLCGVEKRKVLLRFKKRVKSGV